MVIHVENVSYFLAAQQMQLGEVPLINVRLFTIVGFRADLLFTKRD